MNRKHIHRLAALISESYEGLEDADEFEFNISDYGYGCDSGCWAYESFPFVINGQHFTGSLTLEYDVDAAYHKGYRPTRYDPGEPAHWEIYINDPKVANFEVMNADHSDTLVKWHTPSRSRPTGFAVGYMSDEDLQNVFTQAIEQFNQDEERVEQYEMEASYDAGSW